MSLSPKKRFAVLNRDGRRCRYCGRAPQDGVLLHVDHVIPRSHGGSDDMDNLVTACGTCNLGKATAPLLPPATIVEVHLAAAEGGRAGRDFLRRWMSEEFGAAEVPVHLGMADLDCLLTLTHDELAKAFRRTKEMYTAPVVQQDSAGRNRRYWMGQLFVGVAKQTYYRVMHHGRPQAVSS